MHSTLGNPKGLPTYKRKVKHVVMEELLVSKEI